jgi:hypothetical protein
VGELVGVVVGLSVILTVGDVDGARVAPLSVGADVNGELVNGELVKGEDVIGELVMGEFVAFGEGTAVACAANDSDIGEAKYTAPKEGAQSALICTDPLRGALKDIVTVDERAKS